MSAAGSARHIKHAAALRPGRFDLILATGAWGTFSLARRLSKGSRGPFVLDYRDPWTAGDPHEIHTRSLLLATEGSRDSRRRLRRLDRVVELGLSSCGSISPTPRRSR